ncbi:MAG: ATP-binding protein [Cycloclasticus pugetii]|jgi:adenylate kinase
MTRKIIFIGGIHGVGKSTLCTKIFDLLGIKSYSASKLIQSVSNLEFPLDKKIQGINKNQDLLITAVEEHVNPNIYCLLDGHFCLLNQNGEVSDIPLTTFTELSPAATIVLTNEPGTIYTQIKDRDGTEMDIKKITAFQDRELEYSKLVSQALNIPWLTDNPVRGVSHIQSFINDVIREDT